MGNTASAKAYASFVFALILFGSNGIVASAIDLPSFQIVYLRTGIGSFFLVALLLLSRKSLASISHRKDLAFLLASGFALGVGWLFLYEAFQRVGVSLSSLVYYCGPIIVMALSPVLLKERLGAVKITCFAIVVTGLLFINGNGASDSFDVIGMACAVGSAIMFAIMVICNKKAAAITGLENSALQLLFSFITVAVFTVATTGTPMVAVPQNQWLPVIVLGLVNTGLGCYLYFGVFDELPTQTVATL
ncbi:MAG: DMT family transporter, partial [Eggerthellaceae bacterium]|nr:DMT family transporter [Eggerthellaceae bacterium]